MKIRITPVIHLDIEEVDPAQVENVVHRLRVIQEQLEADMAAAFDRQLLKVFPGAKLTVEPMEEI